MDREDRPTFRAFVEGILKPPPPLEEEESFSASLKQFLDAEFEAFEESQQESLFFERFDTLMQSEDTPIQQASIQWALACLIATPDLPLTFSETLYQRIRPLKDAWLAPYLINWLDSDNPYKQPDIPLWLSELAYTTPSQQAIVIRYLFRKYRHPKENTPLLPAITKALIQFDTSSGEATDLALQSFPTPNKDLNEHLISFLGKSGRLRAVKPLIAFAKEYPEYLRTVSHALRRLTYDDVDQFYLGCLDEAHKNKPMVLIEAVKQIRHRRLTKAKSALEALFPMENHHSYLINQTLNSEIALTLASFGATAWAREKLLPDMMLNGIHLKYLKAIEMLQLEEAIPYLKALLLLPTSTQTAHIQEKAYLVCKGLLNTAARTAQSAVE